MTRKHALSAAAAVALALWLGGRQSHAGRPMDPDTAADFQDTLRVLGWMCAAGSPGALLVGGLVLREDRRLRVDRERC